MNNKKIILAIFSTALLFGCFLQREHYDTVRKTPKLKYETPPGGVWLHDNIFMDKCEIRNLDYVEFLYWLDREDPKNYRAMLPDTLCWGYSEKGKRLSLYYLRHPTYRNYPVVGVSYEQAIAFCNWRSDRVNEFLYVRDHYSHIKNLKWDTISHFTKIVKYTLPTKEQWEYAAAAGLDFSNFPNGYQSLIDKNNIPVSPTLEFTNLFPHYSDSLPWYFSRDSCVYLKMIIPTCPVYSGKANSYGISNLLGNVSEIIAGSMFKGLNYETSVDGGTLHLKEENYPIVDSTANGYDYKYTFRYTKPQPFLGFRCVAEVLKER